MSADPTQRLPEDPYQDGHGSTTFTVEHYDLDLTYRVRTNRLTGVATLRIRTLDDLGELTLGLAWLVVERVTVVGAVLTRYRHRDGRLVLRLAERVAAGSVLTVTVRYGGTPRPIPSRWGAVGWEELDDGVVVASQPTGAPSWFPCNDRPSDKATYRTSVTVENPYHVLAHGSLVSRRVGAGATTWVYEEQHPTAAYLATVQIGHYVDILLATGPVPQRALVPEPLAALARVRLAHHAEVMTLFVELFGPYPFTAYTVVFAADELEIPVEAQGASIFGANHLAAGGDGLRLVPHELAHQWFGNSVSVASWQHIWLSEGFASYAEWLWSEASGQAGADELAQLHRAALVRRPQTLVLADPGPANIFDDRVYKRGALTLHALRRTLGDGTFFDLVRAWTERHRYGTVTTDDFRTLVQEHAGRVGGPLLAGAAATLLTDWLDRTAVPALPRPGQAGVVARRSR